MSNRKKIKQLEELEKELEQKVSILWRMIAGDHNDLVKEAQMYAYSDCLHRVRNVLMPGYDEEE